MQVANAGITIYLL